VAARAQLGDLHARLLDGDPPADDDEELLARLVLQHDLAPARVGAAGGDGQDRRLLLVREVLEERDAAQRLEARVGLGGLRRGLGLPGDLDHHRGDVVLAAALVREVDEPLGQLGHRLGGE
jgi:hypothetical protein